MIPDSLVEEVRSRADIVELIGEQLPLKKAGKEYRALCPFHQEKTPSFYVVPGKGFYKCFGCGESGDVFSFLMKRQGLEFQDAVRAVARRVGVEIPEPSESRREEDSHRAVREAVAFAADFFRRMLRDDLAGARARAYLEARGIEEAAAERFQLGFAPDAWRALREAAATHGMADEVLLEAGLVKTSERMEEPYDRLRDRLIFPIPDITGRIVAFGGRALGKAAENTPKYLNSPETPIYHKGDLLYGIHWAKGAIRREESALVVEGYMDYVSLAARGIENVVAGLGTAMTAEQAALVARYTRTAYLLYDSDAAGLRATFRSGDALLRAGVHPLVVTLPVGEDPDSVVRKGGAAALRPHVEAAVDVLERKLQILDERHYLEDVEGLRRGLDRLLPTLRAVTDPALRDIYVTRVAERTGVRPETIERELGPGAPFGGARLAARRPDVAPRRVVREEEWAAERLLLVLMLADEARIPQAAEAIRPDELRDPVHRQIFEALVEYGPPQEDGAGLGLTPPALARVAELRKEPQQITDGDRTFADAVADIRTDGLLLEIDEISRQLELAPEPEKAELMRRKQELMKKREGARLGFKVSPRYRRHRSAARPDRSGPSTTDA